MNITELCLLQHFRVIGLSYFCNNGAHQTEGMILNYITKTTQPQCYVIYVQPLFKNDGLCLLYMCMHSAVFHNELCHLNFSLAQLYCIFKGAEICVTLYGFFKLYNLLLEISCHVQN